VVTRHEITLDFPPSANRYYRVLGSRVLISREGRRYRMKTVSRLGGIRPIDGDLALVVHLYPPDRRRRDADNCLKCLQDSLVHAGAMRDDSQVKILHVEMLDPIPGGKVYVLVERKEDYRRRHAGEAAP
jgi:Holliday junction resolvase RusA-like endonuclease